MRFEPKSEEEVSSFGLLSAGEYEFEVASAADQISQSGNDMVKLLINVYDKDGKRYGVFDYLVGTDGMAYKVRHFAATTGLLKEYEKGEMLAEQMVGCTGICKIVIQKQAGYDDKNSVRDYVVREDRTPRLPTKTSGKVASKGEVDLEDDIPF